MDASPVASTQNGETEYASPRPADAHGACSNIDISPTKNGGFAVRCSYKATPDKKGLGGYQEPEQYAFSTFEELVSFLRDELGAGTSASGADADADDIQTDQP